MKKRWIWIAVIACLVCAIVLFVVMVSQANKGAAQRPSASASQGAEASPSASQVPAEPVSAEDAAYAYGVVVGNAGVLDMADWANVQQVVAGYEAWMDGDETTMTRERALAIFEAYDAAEDKEAADIFAALAAEGKSSLEDTLSAKDLASYALGVAQGGNTQSDYALLFTGVDPAHVALTKQALRAVLLTNDATMDIATAQAKVSGRYQQHQEELAQQAKEEGAQFLAENKTKQGVQETASGLQYKVEKLGDGEKPTTSDTVRVNYEGTLLDGTVFDSTYARGQSAEFSLEGVIAGWAEGLPLMPVGSTYTFYIPYDLAYGEAGNSSIPGYSTLIFKVELLEIVKE
nr:FKBP-type peptidyl-prolyl cis-trans isomerase [Maliibacterium massiliense]